MNYSQRGKETLRLREDIKASLERYALSGKNGVKIGYVDW